MYLYITGSTGLDNSGVTGLRDDSTGVGRPSGTATNWVAAKNAPQENEPEVKEKVPEGPQKTE